MTEDHYESDLDWRIHCAIDEWATDRLDQYRDYQPGVLGFLDSIADAILKGSWDLISPEELEGMPEELEGMRLAKKPITFLDTFPIRETVLERIQERVAFEYCTQTAAAASRVLDLGRLVLLAETNEAVSRFLGRLGRCYVAGFLPECVILCRSVVENGLNEKFEKHGIPPPLPEQGKSTYGAKISEARRYKWLSNDQARAAKQVIHRGNTAIHDDPFVTAQVLETIEMTMVVLSALYGSAP